MRPRPLRNHLHRGRSLTMSRVSPAAREKPTGNRSRRRAANSAKHLVQELFISVLVSFFLLRSACLMTSCHKSALQFIVYILGLLSGTEKLVQPPLPPCPSALPRYFYTEAGKLRLTPHAMWQIFFISDDVCELLLSTANCARMGCSTSALKRLAAPVFSPTAHSAGLLSLLLVLPCLLAVFLMCLLCLLSLPLSHASWFLLGKSTASGQ